MALITKTQVAEVFDIDVDSIPDTLYDWAKNQMLGCLGQVDSDTAYTHREIAGSTTSFIQLNKRDIKTIDTLVIAGTSITITMDTNVTVNEDTGLMRYTGGFGGGQKVVVGFTVNAYTPNEYNDQILALFLLKSLGLFQPDALPSSIKSVTIGRFKKTFGTSPTNLEAFIRDIDAEINILRAKALGDDGFLKIGTIQ